MRKARPAQAAQGMLPLMPRLGEIDQLYVEACLTKCTACRHVAPLDDFDCAGLDEDMLVCPECGHVDTMERFW